MRDQTQYTYGSVTDGDLETAWYMLDHDPAELTTDQRQWKAILRTYRARDVALLVQRFGYDELVTAARVGTLIDYWIATARED